jgi:hypothetical protein
MVSPGFASRREVLQIPLVCGIGRQQRFSYSLAPGMNSDFSDCPETGAQLKDRHLDLGASGRLPY